MLCSSYWDEETKEGTLGNRAFLTVCGGSVVKFSSSASPEVLLLCPSYGETEEGSLANRVLFAVLGGGVGERATEPSSSLPEE